MIGIITAMSCQIKRNGETTLPRGKIASIKRIAFRRGRETGVLTYGPGPDRIHGCIRTSKIRRYSCSKTLQDLGPVHSLWLTRHELIVWSPRESLTNLYLHQFPRTSCDLVCRHVECPSSRQWILRRVKK